MRGTFLNILVALFIGCVARYVFDGPAWAAFSLAIVLTAILETKDTIMEKLS